MCRLKLLIGLTMSLLKMMGLRTCPSSNAFIASSVSAVRFDSGCFVSSEGRGWYRREMWTARFNLNGQLMSFSGRWTWDGVPCPRQRFSPRWRDWKWHGLASVTPDGELFDPVRLHRAALRPQSARISSPPRFSSESVLNQKWDPHAIANQMRSNEKKKLMQVCWYYRAAIPRAVSESTASRQN